MKKCKHVYTFYLVNFEILFFQFPIFRPYEDNTLRVHQIPIFPPEQQIEDNSANESKEYVGPQNLQQVDVAFLVELKKGPKVLILIKNLIWTTKDLPNFVFECSSSHHSSMVIRTRIGT